MDDDGDLKQDTQTHWHYVPLMEMRVFTERFRAVLSRSAAGAPCGQSEMAAIIDKFEDLRSTFELLAIPIKADDALAAFDGAQGESHG